MFTMGEKSFAPLAARILHSKPGRRRRNSLCNKELGIRGVFRDGRTRRNFDAICHATRRFGSIFGINVPRDLTTLREGDKLTFATSGFAPNGGAIVQSISWEVGRTGGRNVRPKRSAKRSKMADQRKGFWQWLSDGRQEEDGQRRTSRERRLSFEPLECRNLLSAAVPRPVRAGAADRELRPQRASTWPVAGAVPRGQLSSDRPVAQGRRRRPWRAGRAASRSGRCRPKCRAGRLW